MKTFIMLELPESAKDYLRHLQTAFDFDRVPRCKLHLTVKFVGETPASVDTSIRVGMRGIVLPKLNLSVDRIGVFYNRVNVVWAGLGCDVDKLVAFAETVGHSCGLRYESFRPHITIGRTSNYVVGSPAGSVSAVFSPTALVYAESVKVNGETLYRTLERVESSWQA